MALVLKLSVLLGLISACFSVGSKQSADHKLLPSKAPLENLGKDSFFKEVEKEEMLEMSERRKSEEVIRTYLSQYPIIMPTMLKAH